MMDHHNAHQEHVPSSDLRTPSDRVTSLRAAILEELKLRFEVTGDIAEKLGPELLSFCAFASRRLNLEDESVPIAAAITAVFLPKLSHPGALETCLSLIEFAQKSLSEADRNLLVEPIRWLDRVREPLNDISNRKAALQSLLLEYRSAATQIPPTTWALLVGLDVVLLHSPQRVPDDAYSRIVSGLVPELPADSQGHLAGILRHVAPYGGGATHLQATVTKLAALPPRAGEGLLTILQEYEGDRRDTVALIHNLEDRMNRRTRISQFLDERLAQDLLDQAVFEAMTGKFNPTPSPFRSRWFDDMLRRKFVSTSGLEPGYVSRLAQMTATSGEGSEMGHHLGDLLDFLGLWDRLDPSMREIGDRLVALLRPFDYPEDSKAVRSGMGDALVLFSRIVEGLSVDHPAVRCLVEALDYLDRRPANPWHVLTAFAHFRETEALTDPRFPNRFQAYMEVATQHRLSSGAFGLVNGEAFLDLPDHIIVPTFSKICRGHADSVNAYSTLTSIYRADVLTHTQWEMLTHAIVSDEPMLMLERLYRIDARIKLGVPISDRYLRRLDRELDPPLYSSAKARHLHYYESLLGANLPPDVTETMICFLGSGGRFANYHHQPDAIARRGGIVRSILDASGSDQARPRKELLLYRLGLLNVLDASRDPALVTPNRIAAVNSFYLSVVRDRAISRSILTALFESPVFLGVRAISPRGARLARHAAP